MIRLAAVAAFVSTSGCESCDWMPGPIQIEGDITFVGERPADFQVQSCDGPDAKNCSDADPIGGSHYFTALHREGWITCSLPKRWLVFTGSGCETVAFGVLPSDDGSNPYMVDLGHVDVTIVCE